MKAKFIFLTLLPAIISFTTSAQTTIPVGASQTYTTIETAYASGIPSTITGAYIIELQSDYNPASEVYPITLAAKSGASAANYIKITPAAGQSFTITSIGANHIFYLNGADWVNIDGIGKNLTISANNTGAYAAVYFDADATNNTVQNCILQGRSASATAGVVWFATGTSTGNDNNTISSCDITDITSQPYNAIYCNATTSATSADNISISSCSISNFWYAGGASNGILVAGYGSGGTTKTPRKPCKYRAFAF
ncbi:MAG: hypothetical protein WCM76_14315 [Bacteroidota bacterium]